MKLIRILLIASLSAAIAHADKRPNILIFLVDDMGLMDTSVPFVVDDQGKPLAQPLNRLYRTPNMEKLAANGVRFSRFYANSVCSPSRISLLNGQFSARHKTTTWINPKKINPGGPANWNWAGLTEKDVSLQKIFKQAGYVTIHSGKAHLGPAARIGSDPGKINFDINIGGSSIGQPGSYYGKANYGKGLYQVPHLKKYHGSETFLTEAVTVETMKKLTAISKSGKPFFLQRSHYALHTPFHSDKRFINHYADKKIPHNAKAFAALVEGMDKSLGDIVAHLKKLGEAENTLIIFLGDNGSDAPLGDKYGHFSSAPYKGKKGTHYEGGMLAPFIISWAKPNPQSTIQKQFPIKPGIVHKKFATICDIFPTVLHVAKLSAPDGHVVDGQDLTPFFNSRDGAHNQKFLMHFPHPHRSSHYTCYREGDWKLVKHYNKKSATGQFELFNLKDDPYEKKNLAKEQTGKLKAIHKAMQAALDDCEAQYAKSPKKSR